MSALNPDVEDDLGNASMTDKMKEQVMTFGGVGLNGKDGNHHWYRTKDRFQQTRIQWLIYGVTPAQDLSFRYLQGLLHC